MESTETLNNPDRGFYELIQVEIPTTGAVSLDMDYYAKKAKSNNIGIISLQINLKDFVADNKELSSENISEINKLFSAIRNNNEKCIFRVVYDSVGKENCEPSFETILKHIDNLKTVYETNSDILYVVEAGFLGSYGEWHNGKYDTKDYRNQLINKLLEDIPTNIMLNVRTSEFYTELFGSSPISESTAYDKSNASRVGLHNDGYLYSITDYGSYEEANRETELAWEHKQTAYTIFGGEVLGTNSEYTNLDNAVSDMKNRHCQYINGTYEEGVKTKWKNTTYSNSASSYNGLTGYKYIEDHLGYRYVLRSSSVKQSGSKLNVDFSIENTGFANLTQEKNVQIIIKGSSNTYTNTINLDCRKLLAQSTNKYSFSFDITNEMPNGDYDAYIRISDKSDSLKDNNNYCIQFANSGIYDSTTGTNYIGTFAKASINENTNNTVINTTTTNTIANNTVANTTTTNTIANNTTANTTTSNTIANNTVANTTTSNTIINNSNTSSSNTLISNTTSNTHEENKVSNTASNGNTSNQSSNVIKITSINSNEVKSSTTATGVLPKTGETENYILLVLIGISSVISIITYKKIRNYDAK